MNNPYQYFGQPLTPSIAQELILELFAGSTVQRQAVISRVDEIHRELGGHPPNAKTHHPAEHALSKMKQLELVEHQERGIWFVKPLRIEILDDFMKWAKKFPPGKYVFRGVTNEAYGIQASAYRRLKEEDRSFLKFLQINTDLINESIMRGYDEKNGRKLSHLEMLAELQHYGAATCLMDFSYSAQIALWFACQQSKKTSRVPKKPPNGKVFAVSTDLPDFKEVESGMLTDNIEVFLQDEDDSPLYYWQPRQQNNRIIAQQSIFLFGRPEFEADSECVILENSKRNILIELEQVSGITEAMLSPDFEKFAVLRGENMPYTGLNSYECVVLARKQMPIGNYPEVIAYCSRAIDQETDYVEAYYLRGCANYYEGQYSPAISDFDRVITLNPDYTEAYGYRAQLKAFFGHGAEVETDLLKGIQLARRSRDWALATEMEQSLEEFHNETGGGSQDE